MKRNYSHVDDTNNTNKDKIDNAYYTDYTDNTDLNAGLGGSGVAVKLNMAPRF